MKGNGKGSREGDDEIIRKRIHKVAFKKKQKQNFNKKAIGVGIQRNKLT